MKLGVIDLHGRRERRTLAQRVVEGSGKEGVRSGVDTPGVSFGRWMNGCGKNRSKRRRERMSTVHAEYMEDICVEWKSPAQEVCPGWY